jgi:hypothetical protein
VSSRYQSNYYCKRFSCFCQLQACKVFLLQLIICCLQLFYWTSTSLVACLAILVGIIFKMLILYLCVLILFARWWSVERWRDEIESREYQLRLVSWAVLVPDSYTMYPHSVYTMCMEFGCSLYWLYVYLHVYCLRSNMVIIAEFGKRSSVGESIERSHLLPPVQGSNHTRAFSFAKVRTSCDVGLGGHVANGC